MDCAMVAAAPVLPAGYVVSASRIADRRIILAGYRLADLLTRVSEIGPGSQQKPVIPTPY